MPHTMNVTKLKNQKALYDILTRRKAAQEEVARLQNLLSKAQTLESDLDTDADKILEEIATENNCLTEAQNNSSPTLLDSMDYADSNEKVTSVTWG